MNRMFIRTGVTGLLSLLWVLYSLPAQAAFGLSTSNDFYTVDTDAGVVFSIRRTDNGSSTQSPGDLASLVIDGIEYQNQSRGSQINSGFDWLYSNTSAVSVNAQTIGSDFIKITVQAGDLTHYYMARRGYRDIYMATYFTREPDNHGHVRYILRMQRNRLPYGPEPSDLQGVVSTVESGDIFALGNGETRSKHYSNQRLIDWRYIGATGDRIGIWLVRDNQEGGSGGPFYRSLLNQGTDTDQEITYIVNYAEAQTEAYRTGVLNHYTLVATRGSTPTTNIDTSWFANMNLLGYVPPSGRGRVTGVGITNMDDNYRYTVGFANAQAQYWTAAEPGSGHFDSQQMRPGTYTMTTYKNELAVNTQTVSVTAGQTNILHSYAINNDPASQPALWRIGQWDGSPQEFLNGDKLTTMHPSDVRMDNWDPANFIVGSSPTNIFPSYMWKDVNNDHIVYFRLNDSQRSQPHTLRIGLTCAFSGGRPTISVNNWSAGLPSPSSQPSTRTLTVGTYRCNNVTYTFNVPASAWQTDAREWNRLVITAISGSGGTGFLSPGYSIDAVDLLD